MCACATSAAAQFSAPLWPAWGTNRAWQAQQYGVYSSTVERANAATATLPALPSFALPTEPTNSRAPVATLESTKTVTRNISHRYVDQTQIIGTNGWADWLNSNGVPLPRLGYYDAGTVTETNLCRVALVSSNYFRKTPYRFLNGLGIYTNDATVGHMYGYTVTNSPGTNGYYWSDPGDWMPTNRTQLYTTDFGRAQWTNVAAAMLYTEVKPAVTYTQISVLCQSVRDNGTTNVLGVGTNAHTQHGTEWQTSSEEIERLYDEAVAGMVSWFTNPVWTTNVIQYEWTQPGTYIELYVERVIPTNSFGGLNLAETAWWLDARTSCLTMSNTIAIWTGAQHTATAYALTGDGSDIDDKSSPGFGNWTFRDRTQTNYWDAWGIAASPEWVLWDESDEGAVAWRQVTIGLANDFTGLVPSDLLSPPSGAMRSNTQDYVYNTTNGIYTGLAWTVWWEVGWTQVATNGTWELDWSGTNGFLFK